jgi:predicted enzyme related to lactoylglutathione lyase
VTNHPAGAPCWFELTSPDPVASRAFYESLLGWEAEPEPLLGPGVTIERVAGEPAASVRAGDSDEARWHVFVRVDDLDATAAVKAAGGRASAPVELGGAAKVAHCTDDAGIAFSLWQAGELNGAANRGPGTFCWGERLSRDEARARRFYGAVFGWTVEPRPREEYVYEDWMLQDVDVAGLMPVLPSSWPADLPDQWLGYLTVASWEATADHVVALGGTVAAPERIAPGTTVMCRDPHGTVFGIIEFNGDV